MMALVSLPASLPSTATGRIPVFFMGPPGSIERFRFGPQVRAFNPAAQLHVQTIEVVALVRYVDVGTDILEVLADCPTFEADVKAWCAAMHKVLLFMRDEPQNVKRCQVKI